MSCRGKRFSFVIALLLTGATSGLAPAAKKSTPHPPAKPQPAPQVDDQDADSAAGPVAADADEQEDGQQQPAGPPPASYRVQKGDTLWGICQKVFSDPWQWPRIWALNPQVTNPHWIFPDDILAFTRNLPAPVASAVPAQSEPSLPPVQLADPASFGPRIRELGFVSSDEIKQAGKIEGSPEEKIMLTTGDTVYATSSPEQPLAEGKRYVVYTVDWKSPVKDPKTGKLYGYVIQIHGSLFVQKATRGEMASGQLAGLRDPVERGFLVGPVYHQFRSVPPRPAEKVLKAQIIAALQPNWLIAREMFVVLNLGRNGGVQEGNRFFVHRRGDGYGTVLGGWNKQDTRFPEENISELLIVHVQDEVSIGWVSGGKREIAVGEFAESRQGV